MREPVIGPCRLPEQGKAPIAVRGFFAGATPPSWAVLPRGVALFWMVLAACGGGTPTSPQEGPDDPPAVLPPGCLLYVGSRYSHQILRYEGSTGTLSGTGVFVPAGAAGLAIPAALTFGPDGNLYVSSGGNDRILRFDGTSGAPIGSGVFVAAGSAGLNGPGGLLFRCTTEAAGSSQASLAPEPPGEEAGGGAPPTEVFRPEPGDPTRRERP